MAGLVSLVGAVLTFWSQSTLRVEAVGQSYDAFSLPFAIQNPSVILTATDVHVACHISELQMQGFRITNSTFEGQKSDFAHIEPGKQALTNCPISLGAVDMTAAVDIQGSYKTFGIERAIRKRVFRWLRTSQPPRWIEDEG